MEITKTMPKHWDICSQIADENKIQTQSVYQSLKRRSRKYIGRYNELVAKYLADVEQYNNYENMRKGAA